MAASAYNIQDPPFPVCLHCDGIRYDYKQTHWAGVKWTAVIYMNEQGDCLVVENRPGDKGKKFVETIKTLPEPGITLHLDAEEARVLRTILGRVGGSPEGPRGKSTKIWEQLQMFERITEHVTGTIRFLDAGASKP
jgi:hypothetical protein